MNALGLNIFVLILALWTIPWKLYAVWTAVKNNHKGWFFALLILNTIGILEIYYIFYVAKKSWPEVKKSFVDAISSKK